MLLQMASAKQQRWQLQQLKQLQQQPGYVGEPSNSSTSGDVIEAASSSRRDRKMEACALL
jgi:hypothetical protein